MATARAAHRSGASSGIFPGPPAPSRALAPCVRFLQGSRRCAVPVSRAPRSFRRTVRRARAAARRAGIIPLHRPGRRFRKSACPSPRNRTLSWQTRGRWATGSIALHLSQTRFLPPRSMLFSVRQVRLPFSRSLLLAAPFPEKIRAGIPPLPFARVPVFHCPPCRSSSAPPRRASPPANGKYRSARASAA